MRGHTYQQALATHKVTTAYGTFHICPACVIAKHCGLKYGNRLERLSVESPARVCECEHVYHMKPTDDLDAQGRDSVARGEAATGTE